MSTHEPLHACHVCGQKFPQKSMIAAALVRPPVAQLISQAHPGWKDDSQICLTDLNRFRSDYIELTLRSQRGELSSLEQEVISSLREHEVLAENLNEEFQSQITFGEHVADQMARFGGSWTFILVFACLLLLWIGLNTLPLFFKAFDPYPFIFLNLVLSCLAAIQAPIIMMSQNRLQARDSLRAEHDFRINLKAELEIRHLHSKLDLLLTHQWQRLLEIQQLQTDLLEEIAQRQGIAKRSSRRAEPPSGGEE